MLHIAIRKTYYMYEVYDFEGFIKKSLRLYFHCHHDDCDDDDYYVAVVIIIIAIEKNAIKAIFINTLNGRKKNFKMCNSSLSLSLQLTVSAKIIHLANTIKPYV